MYRLILPFLIACAAKKPLETPVVQQVPGDAVETLQFRPTWSPCIDAIMAYYIHANCTVVESSNAAEGIVFVQCLEADVVVDYIMQPYYVVGRDVLDYIDVSNAIPVCADPDFIVFTLPGSYERIPYDHR